MMRAEAAALAMSGRAARWVWWAAPMVLVALATLFSLRNDFWYDEIYSIELTAHPLHRLIGETARDVHPPLYYVMLKALGAYTLPMVARLFSAVCVAAAALVLARAYRAERGEAAAACLLALLACSPLMVRYGGEARQYAPLLLAHVVALGAAVRIGTTVAPATASALYGAATLAGLYTHNLMALFAAPLALAMLALAWRRPGADQRRVLGLWLGTHAALGAAYLPWFLVVRSQASERIDHLLWMPPPRLFTWAEVFALHPLLGTRLNTVPAYWLVWPALTFLFLAGAWCALRGSRSILASVALFCLVSATAMAHAFSAAGTPVLFAPRFALLAVPAVALVFAEALHRLRNGGLQRAARKVLLLVVCVLLPIQASSAIGTAFRIENFQATELLHHALADPGLAPNQPARIVLATERMTRHRALSYARQALKADAELLTLPVLLEEQLQPRLDAPIWLVFLREDLAERERGAVVGDVLLTMCSVTDPPYEAPTFVAHRVEEIDYTAIARRLAAGPQPGK